MMTHATDRTAQAERLAVDLTAVDQRVQELDRRVTALHLLMAADDARHIEQAIIDAAAAATDLHKVTGVLGGSGLVQRLAERVEDLADPVLARRFDQLLDDIDATRRRVARSAVLTRVAASQLDQQLGQVLVPLEQTGMYSSPSQSAPNSSGPRLVDRLA